MVGLCYANKTKISKSTIDPDTDINIKAGNWSSPALDNCSANHPPSITNAMKNISAIYRIIKLILNSMN